MRGPYPRIIAAKKRVPSGIVTSAARPIRQSSRKIRRILHRGAAMLEGSSGMKWAIESSNFATLSTIRFLKVPVGVSNMTPMGTFAIRSVMASRIFFSMVKDILWEIREDCQVSSIFMIWQTAAPPQRGSTSMGVAVPRYSASARTATIKNGPMPNSSPKTARKIEKRILPLLSPTKANNCRIAPGSFDFITRLLSGHKKYKEGIAFLSTLC